VHRELCGSNFANCASHCAQPCAPLNVLSMSQAFHLRYGQELKLRYVSGVQQQDVVNHQPAYQPLPGAAGITLDSHGDSVYLKTLFALVRSPGARCSLSAGCPYALVLRDGHR